MLITKKGILLLSTCSATAALAVSKRQASLCTDIRDRVPWTQLTSDEKTSYINADLCLMALPSTSGIPGAVSRWDDLQWPHVVQTNWVHGVVSRSDSKSKEIMKILQTAHRVHSSHFTATT